MSQNPKKPKNGQDQDADVEAAWLRLFDNKNDEIENTFCYQLFELNYFDEERFSIMCNDMAFALEKKPTQKENYKLLVWIISCVFRCVFSHLDKSDLYKIKNFDAEISEKWSEEYLEKLRNLLDDVFDVAVQ